jgi:hypothetical protein
MTRTLLRGRILTFHADPAETDDNHLYIENGAILIADGVIEAVGDHDELRRQGLADGAREIDHRPHLILPGFIDPHIHFPQVQVIASWGAQLLDWLNRYTFPEEARYADNDPRDPHGGRLSRPTRRAWHDDGLRVLLGPPGQHGGVVRGGGCARHGPHRRKGDDGPQRARGRAGHRAVGL